MELTEKQGYKQSEVGLIPEDWSLSILNDLTDITRLAGYEYSTLWQETPNGEITALRGFNIGSNKIIERDLVYISDSLSKRLIRSRLFKNDIVYPCVGSIGNAVVIEDDDTYHIQQNIAKITPKKNKVSPHYLAYYLMSEFGLKEIERFNGSSSQPNILVGSLRQYNIVTPTLAEQKAIATALSDVDELIANLDQLITKKKAIKQGAMQQLLTPPHKGGKRLEGFSGEWEEKTLGEVGVCIRGVTYSGDSDLYPFDNSNSLRLLRSNNIFDKNIVFSNLQYVKKERVKPYQIMQSKDILICMANGSKALVGKAGQYKGASNQYTYGAFMGVFRLNVDEWNADFIFNIFSTNLFRCHLDIQLSGSSINNLNPSDIEIFKFHFPSSPEQKAIAQILSDMDLEIVQLEAKKAKYQSVKQGMMQELLTGKTRLV